MTVTNVTKDPIALTMSITAEFDVSVERAWELWNDPRQLERWWGPPTFPATFVEHDLTVGGTVRYFMTGPDGERHSGWWTVVSVEPPHSLEVVDGFADDTGAPVADMPTTSMRVTLTGTVEGGTTMVIESRFPSTEAMEQLVAMGMEEGMRLALGQIDGILADALT